MASERLSSQHCASLAAPLQTVPVPALAATLQVGDDGQVLLCQDPLRWRDGWAGKNANGVPCGFTCVAPVVALQAPIWSVSCAVKCRPKAWIVLWEIFALNGFVESVSCTKKPSKKLNQEVSLPWLYHWRGGTTWDSSSVVCTFASSAAWCF